MEKSWLCASIVVLLLCSFGLADGPDLLAMVSTMEAFLDRQLDKFPIPDDYPPGFENAQLIQTYDRTPGASTTYVADLYDSATALIAYTVIGRMDRARSLADGIRLLQVKDPYDDGRIRKQYWANDLLDPWHTGPSIMWPGEALVGDMSWAGVALTRFYDASLCTGFLSAEQAEPYLQAARDIAQWIITNEWQGEPFGGFSMGRTDANDRLFGTPHARSTEFNIDAYVLACNLAHLDPAECAKWRGMADHAQAFVHAMFNPSAPEPGWYWIGARDDGQGNPVIDNNPTHIPADGQTWCVLSGLDTTEPCDCLRFIQDTSESDPKHLIVTDRIGDVYPDDPREYRGVRWTTETMKHIHVRSEVTAGYALAILVAQDRGCIGGPEWTQEITNTLGTLDRVRTEAPGADPNGIGVVATPWPNPYGEDPPNLRHVASTVWTGLAAMYALGDPCANPLLTVPPADFNGDCRADLDDFVILKANFGRTGALCSEGDADGDGDVDLDDFVILKNHFGTDASYCWSPSGVCPP